MVERYASVPCPIFLYSLVTFLGPKSPGLIVLEHELDDRSVQTFIDAYPKIKDNGWNMKSVVDCASAGSPYQVKDKPASPEESASQSETSSSSMFVL